MAYTYSSPTLNGDLTINHDNTEVTFTETTGSYNAVTNPTGWAIIAPGMPIGNVDDSTLTITTPSGDVFIINTFPTLPASTDTDITFNLGDLGGTSGDVFPDGLYTVKQTVIDNVLRNPLKPLVKYFFICFDLEKCISKSLANAKISDCNCKCEDIKGLLHLYTLWRALKYAICTGNITRINKLYESAVKVCEQLNCKNC